MAIHFRYGGSVAARLIQCPGYLQAVDKLTPVSKPNPYAQRGTNLHNIQEHLRNELLVPAEYSITENYPSLTPAEVVDYVEVTHAVYNMTDEILDKYEVDDYICEPLVKAYDDMGGSIDMLAYNTTTAVIIDYKMGHNPVDAKYNKQGLFYFFATTLDKKYSHLVAGKKLVFVIIQPNRAPDIWEITPEDLAKFTVEYTNAVAQSKDDNPPLNAGASCKYCGNAPYCKALQTHAQKGLYLSKQQKTSIEESLKIASMLESWISDVYAEAEAIMIQGEKLEGFKLVAKQARKQWRDKNSFASKYSYTTAPEFYKDPELKTPTQILKQIKDDKVLTEEITPEIIAKSSGYNVVPESDKRKAVDLSTPDALKNLLKKS